MIRGALLAVTAYAVLFAHSTPARPAPARLGVQANEYHLVLSRGSVKAGPALIQLQNLGQDPHDLRLQRIGGKHTSSGARCWITRSSACKPFCASGAEGGHPSNEGFPCKTRWTSHPERERQL